MLKKIVVALGLACALSLSAVAQSTTVIGTFKSGDGVTAIASGQVAATLQPGIDTVASGTARFSPTEVDCTINGDNVNANQAVRATNSVTISGLPGHTFIVNDVVQVAGMTDSTFNGTFTITATTATTITYSQTAGNATSGGGTLSALRAISGSGACTVATNTLMQPSSTSWKFCVQPQFIQPGSCFVAFATGGTLDITAQPATPPLTPAYQLVDTFSNQVISGTKTFTNLASTFGGPDPFVDVLSLAYGCKGDGVSDDSACFTALNNFTASHPGAVVWFGTTNANTFLTSVQLAINPGVQYYGNGGGTRTNLSTNPVTLLPDPLAGKLIGTTVKWTGATNTPVIKMFDVSHALVTGINVDCGNISGCVGYGYDSDNNPPSSYNTIQKFTVKGAHLAFSCGRTDNVQTAFGACNSNSNQAGCYEADFITIRDWTVLGNGSDATGEAVHINSSNCMQASLVDQSNAVLVNKVVHVVQTNGSLEVKHINGGSPVGALPTVIQVDGGNCTAQGPDLTQVESEGGWVYAVHDSGCPSSGFATWRSNQWFTDAPLGTISVTSGSGTVTGTTTNFLTRFAVGSIIIANGEFHTVSSVTGDTLMATDNWTNNFSGAYANAGVLIDGTESITVTGEVANVPKVVAGTAQVYDIGHSSGATYAHMPGSSGEANSWVNGNIIARRSITTDSASLGGVSVNSTSGSGTGTGNIVVSGTGNISATGGSVTSNKGMAIGQNNGSAIVALLMDNSPIAGASTFGIDGNITIPSSTTTEYDDFASLPATAAASFTLAKVSHFKVSDVTVGSGSAVTLQNAFECNALTHATTNQCFVNNGAAPNNLGTGKTTNGGQESYTEGTPTGAAAGQDVCQGSSASHNLQCSYNNGGFLPLQQAISTSFTTTAATTDNVTVTGMTASGHCYLTPTNSGAAGGIASVFISTKTTNQITVTHTATAAWTFDVVCTPQ